CRGPGEHSTLPRARSLRKRTPGCGSIVLDRALGPGATILADIGDVRELLGHGLGHGFGLARMHRLVAPGADHHRQFLLEGGSHLLGSLLLLGSTARPPPCPNATLAARRQPAHSKR